MSVLRWLRLVLADAQLYSFMHPGASSVPQLHSTTMHLRGPFL